MHEIHLFMRFINKSRGSVARYYVKHTTRKWLSKAISNLNIWVKQNTITQSSFNFLPVFLIRIMWIFCLMLNIIHIMQNMLLLVKIFVKVEFSKQTCQNSRLYNIKHYGASLVVQWLRICLLMQGTQVQALGLGRSHILWCN